MDMVGINNYKTSNAFLVTKLKDLYIPPIDDELRPRNTEESFLEQINILPPEIQDIILDYYTELYPWKAARLCLYLLNTIPYRPIPNTSSYENLIKSDFTLIKSDFTIPDQPISTIFDPISKQKIVQLLGQRCRYWKKIKEEQDRLGVLSISFRCSKVRPLPDDEDFKRRLKLREEANRSPTYGY